MKISKQGLNLLKLNEGLKLSAYLDTENYWTIGFGNRYINGRQVIEGDKISEQQAFDLLYDHLEKHVYPFISAIKIPLTQYQFDALCSFIYNIGGSAFSKSTMLKLLNQNNIEGAKLEFMRWTKQKELTARRCREKQMFEGKV